MWPPTPVPFNLETEEATTPIFSDSEQAERNDADIPTPPVFDDENEAQTGQMARDAGLKLSNTSNNTGNQYSNAAITKSADIKDVGRAAPSPPPSSNGDDHGDPVRALRELIVWPIRHRELVHKLGGVRVPKGILLVGAPGVGKTRAVRLLAQEVCLVHTFTVHFFSICISCLMHVSEMCKKDGVHNIQIPTLESLIGEAFSCCYVQSSGED
jgi:hypothetical protein